MDRLQKNSKMSEGLYWKHDSSLSMFVCVYVYMPGYIISVKSFIILHCYILQLCLLCLFIKIKIAMGTV